MANHPNVQLTQTGADGWSFLYTGRLFSRVAGIGYLHFYPNMDCMIDGFYKTNGKGYYELGECFGRFIHYSFDFTIG